MNKSLSQKPLLVAILGVLMLPACTTTVYKEDVKKFSIGVDNTMVTFELLREKSYEKTTANTDSQVAGLCGCGKCPKIRISDSCRNMVDKEVKPKTQCFTVWAEYRSSGSKGRTPSKCEEPVDFYQLPIEKSKDCELQLIKDTSETTNKCSAEDLEDLGEINNSDLNKKKAFLNTAKMSEQLAAYASALGKIVSAKDVEDLTTSVADAKTALSGLATTVSKETDKPVPIALGPISELLGTVLVWALETKRFNTMKTIVNEADPLVRESAKILSRYSLPLSWKVVINPALDNLENTRARMLVAGGLDESNAKIRSSELRAARGAYLNAFVDDPSAAYEAMADAHTALKKALNDPDRQIEIMNKAIGEFHTKSVAVREALSKISDTAKTN